MALSTDTFAAHFLTRFFDGVRKVAAYAFLLIIIAVGTAVSSFFCFCL